LKFRKNFLLLKNIKIKVINLHIYNFKPSFLELNVDLIIRAVIKIPLEFYGYTYIISDLSKYSGDKSMFKNIFKFNYETKNSRSKVWIMREMTSVN
jgi:hypothetical protein